ncbi:MAG: nucleotide exchange factor GrpE [Candidatus Faecivicinus sp.]|nr:nucleotide exchange factor GrpE [Candidatus Faecivicinus sp.]
MKKDKNPPEAEQQTQQTADVPPENTEEPVEETHQATEAEWREALETAVKQRDEYLDSLRRSQADFQNFKRRNQTARADGYQDGLCDTITAMLPVIDNLERALDAAQEGDPLAEGVKMTLKMMLDALSRFGFEEVPAEGEEFDPDKHNAVMRETGDEPGKVLEVFQKGYKVKDKIIRYAMVKVATD